VKRLVIDADVAAKANSENSTNLDCRLCDECLEAVRDSGHALVLSEQLADEWVRHASFSSQTWLVQMYARKRVRRVEIQSDGDLGNAVFAAHTTGLSRAEVLKDAHLATAALASDNTVISGDRRARRAFATASSTVRPLGRIIWADPTLEIEAVVQWLVQGASPDAVRRLDRFEF
jgi:hypothetical protein